jgi:hypothetical protein
MYNSDIPSRADLPTTGQLIRSTLVAAVTATLLLVTVVLPAEYAIDPTGIGKALGLQNMGEIKQQLKEDAEFDGAALPSKSALTVEPSVQSGSTNSSIQKTASAADQITGEEAGSEKPMLNESIVVTLAPGESAEVKLVMKRNAAVDYEWNVDQGHLNSDLHGDGTAGQATSYRKGRAESKNQGTLTAAFDGNHGWFWRNRSDVPTKMTLRLRGQYSKVKRVL